MRLGHLSDQPRVVRILGVAVHGERVLWPEDKVSQALCSGPNHREDTLEQPALPAAGGSGHDVARELHAVVRAECDGGPKPCRVVAPAERRAVRHPVLGPEQERAAGARVIPTLWNDESDESRYNRTLLPKLRAAFSNPVPLIGQLVGFAVDHDLDGWNLDFELGASEVVVQQDAVELVRFVDLFATSRARHQRGAVGASLSTRWPRREEACRTPRRSPAPHRPTVKARTRRVALQRCGLSHHNLDLVAACVAELHVRDVVKKVKTRRYRATCSCHDVHIHSVNFTQTVSHSV